jgi:histidinol dehydrogenase
MTPAVRRLSTAAPGFDADLDALCAFESAQDPAVDAAVASIIDDVRARGDRALLDYTRRFDWHAAPSIAALAIGADEMRHAHDALPDVQRDALGRPRSASARSTRRRRRTASASRSPNPTARGSASA